MNKDHIACNHSHRGHLLKFIIPLMIAGLTVRAATAQPPTPPGDKTLRHTLARLVAEGQVPEALRQAQAALKARPNDPGVQFEFIDLHMSLARDWFRRREFDHCEAALQAILAVDADYAPARALRAEIHRARSRAARGLDEVDRLLRFELFEAALDQIQLVKALRPASAKSLNARERAARLGVADDHYLAQNFSEAFAVYENLIWTQPKASRGVRRRWGISLALALSENDPDRPADPDLTAGVLARTADVLTPLSDPLIERLIRGLLAERSGPPVEAGRFLAAALGEVWELPAVDRRQAAATNLRNRAIKKLHELYQTTPTRRRAGAWAISLPNVWKSRHTPHFDVYARSDLVSGYVADVLEYHFAGIARWLGVEVSNDWTPHCEIRVYAGLEAFHAATETGGITRAVSRTRRQGNRVLLRKISVYQSDPWLLSSTLPHELTHILLAEALRSPSGGGEAIVPPFALDEGLAVHAEPPARRLQYRRLLASRPPNPLNLMKIGQIIGDQASFYARSAALAEFILRRKGMAGFLAVCRGADASWWLPLDWPDADAMLADWKPWYAARRNPPRMPLMLLTQRNSDAPASASQPSLKR